MDEGLDDVRDGPADGRGVLRTDSSTVERYFGGLVPWTYMDVPWSRDIDGNRAARLPRRAGWDAPSQAVLAVLAGVGRDR